MKLEEVITIVRAAGDSIAELQGTITSDTKADGSPVSLADHRSESILLEGLSAFGYPVVSEEDTLERSLQKETFWIIDPLDGTKDFLAGRAEWAIMAGLVIDGSVALGVVYAPSMHTLWYAQKGEGAFAEVEDAKKTIQVSNATKPEGARALCSYSHRSASAEAHLKRLGFSIRRIGSSGVKIALIASGEADAFWTDAPLREWDVCAAHIILEEAGGRVSDMHGNTISYSGDGRALRGCAASNGRLHEAILS